MTRDTVFSIDENTRRYYLDAMGIQCWEMLESYRLESQQPESPQTEPQQTDRDVNSSQAKQSLISWPQLQAGIQQCEKCPLHKTRKQAIIGRGNQSAELMFVLIAPDTIDDESGVLCDGEANKLFGKMLAAINLSVNDVYITSLLKCSVAENHTISPGEIHQCKAHLKHQVQLIQPKILVLLGETTARCLMQKNLSLDDFRAMVNNEIKTDAPITGQYQFDSIPLFVAYSPQELLLQTENKRKAWLDLQQLQKLIQ